MADELKLQKMIVDAVNATQGRAFKSNNRFLIGVSDLLIKLKNRPAGFLEVKQRNVPMRDHILAFRLDVTYLQAKFLHEMHNAGMPCGVASFLQDGHGNSATYFLHIQPWRSQWKPGDELRASANDHIQLSRKPVARAHDILTHLYQWHDEWKRQ